MTSPADRVRRALPSALTALAVTGCAACCALPLLLAAGVLSGGVAAGLYDWVPGVAAALIAAAVITWWWNTRRKTHSSGCAGGDFCSCAADTDTSQRSTSLTP